MSTIARLVTALLFAGTLSTYSASADAEPASRDVTYDRTFWTHWSDGKAELAAYDITYPRYGVPRAGTAVTIFVKEDFSNANRVKADPGKHPADDTFPVIKLNLVQDFPTGIYDYNMMTSAFVALQAVNGRPAGTPTKVSFSAQEWCGHAYHQLLFDSVGIREILHSYFDGEADRAGTLDYPRDGVSEDALWFWARGMATPALAPGASVERPLLQSLERTRLRHQPATWQTATFSRSAEAQRVSVPGGDFETEVYTVTPADGRTVSLYVETAAPHRIVRWETSDGYVGELLKSARLPYWQMNGPGFPDALKDLGLTPRPARTP